MTEPNTTEPTVTVPDITISKAALDLITQEAQRSRDGLETGGILLGYDHGKRIEILHAGDPGPKAKRGTHTFDRDLTHAQTLAGAAWERDRSQWIGEWHTHPNQQPAPSPRDLDSYTKHLRDPDLNFNHFIAIIVGLDPLEGTIAVTWLINQDHAHPVPLRRTA